jgi:hypothetical protein
LERERFSSFAASWRIFFNSGDTLMPITVFMPPTYKKVLLGSTFLLTSVFLCFTKYNNVAIMTTRNHRTINSQLSNKVPKVAAKLHVAGPLAMESLWRFF